MQNGMIIRVPDGSGLVSQIQRKKYLPLYGRPLKLRIPGAVVVMVQAGGVPCLIGRATRLEGPVPVTPIGGRKKKDGYRLRLKAIKRPNPPKPV